nr:hypothetical protein [Anaerolineae bacterium]
MATTTILHEFEDWLLEREQKGEINKKTRQNYMNDASRIFEVMLSQMPANVIEGYLRSEGYRGYYGHLIEALRAMARSRGEKKFHDPGQSRLPGV